MTARVPDIGGPKGWMWTPEQWAEIVRCARQSHAYRGCAKSDRWIKKLGIADRAANPLMWERRARRDERRILFLASQWGVL